MKSFLYCLLICSCFLMANAAAESKAMAVYNEPLNASEAALREQLKSAPGIEEVIGIINDNFDLPEELEFVFGGEDGPLYDPEINKILIPYAFITEVKERFVAAKYAETGVSPDDATIDSLLHTLFHELAHALINMYQLPVLGREEDAADALATFLLIRFFEDGQEIALSAADLFDLESEDREELSEEDFWGEHSLDAQRFYSTLCHVYGSAPEKYDGLLEQSGLSADRADLCIEEYANLAASWMALLRPHMKDN